MSWKDEAACAPDDAGPLYPTDWFVPTEEFLLPENRNKWKPLGQKVCLTICPVTVECLMANRKEIYGVWGGTLPTHREKYRRKVKDLTDKQARKEAIRVIETQRARLKK